MSLREAAMKRGQQLPPRQIAGAAKDHVIERVDRNDSVDHGMPQLAGVSATNPHICCAASSRSTFRLACEKFSDQSQSSGIPSPAKEMWNPRVHLTFD
jgi:hypothetical protein